MMRYDLVILNMSASYEWKRGVRNRNFFVHRELTTSGRVSKVLSIDLLPHTWRRAAPMILKRIFGPSSGKVLQQSLSHELSQDAPDRFHLSSVEALLSEERFVTTLADILKRLKFENILLWSYLPTYTKVFEQLPRKIAIFDAVDDWSAHPNYRGIQSRLEKNYRTLVNKADVIFTVSKHLLQRFQGHQNAVCIPNGVDTERFLSPKKYQRLEHLHGPRLVYLGVIQERVDIELLTYVAEQRPACQLILAGPVWASVDLARLRALPNVHILGFVHEREVPSLLTSCSIGLVPHQKNDLVASMNPMKVYEYLAAGLPVVATTLEDVPGQGGIIRIAPGKEDFLAGIDSFLASPPDAKFIQAQVTPCTWARRVDDMWRTIEGAHP